MANNGKQNDNVLEGLWNQVQGQLKEQWGKLTDDDLDQIHGKYDKLVGRLQEEYGYSEERAREEVDMFLKSF